MPELRVRGAASDLFRILDPRRFVARDEFGWTSDGPVEILLEGPAGTGKTTGLMAGVFWLCENFPNIRVLLVRLVRKDLDDSHLKAFEEVLPVGHAVLRGCRREGRQRYQFPNGSELVVKGMNRPSGMYSTQYDVVVIGEAFELAGARGEDTYQQFYRATRNNKLPNSRHYIISDTNPAEQTHWLNRRAKDGLMIRLRSQHVDNPALYRVDGSLTGY